MMMMKKMMVIMMITMSIRLCLQAWVRPGWGRMLTYVRNQLTYLLYDASTETTKFRTFPDATQQPGLWAAFTALEELTLLSACYCTLASRISCRCLKRKTIPTAGRERRREGGRKDGRKQETMA